jgi:hypothetical protein
MLGGLLAAGGFVGGLVGGRLVATEATVGFGVAVAAGVGRGDVAVAPGRTEVAVAAVVGGAAGVDTGLGCLS